VTKFGDDRSSDLGDQTGETRSRGERHERKWGTKKGKGKDGKGEGHLRKGAAGE